MQKLVLLSLLFATFSLPFVFSRNRRVARGLGKTRVWFAYFVLIYVFLVAYVAPRLN
jgi:hypothetical protein